MRIDIHIHTEYSRCSSFEFSRLKEKIIELGLEAVTVTDHGVTNGWRELRDELPGILVIPGMEVKSREGDFLVYSTDEDYIIALGPYVPDVTKLRRDDETLVIWAHPRIASETGWQAPHPGHHLVNTVTPYIDAIEVLNDNMIRDKSLTQTKDEYVAAMVGVAKEYNLPMTGGSDTHSASRFMKCWTEFRGGVETVSDFIKKVKSGEVRPGCEESHMPPSLKE